LSAIEERQVLVQGGGFGEHRFTQVTYQRRRELNADEAAASRTDAMHFRQVVEGQLEEQKVEVNDKHFLVHLEPGAQITLDLGMERCVNDPSYALPWTDA